MNPLVTGTLKIILFASPFQELLPRGKHMNPLWEKNMATNAILSAKLSATGSAPNVHLLKHNWNDLILEGTQISHGDFFDFIHLSEAGYRKVFKPVYETVKELLTKSDK